MKKIILFLMLFILVLGPIMKFFAPEQKARGISFAASTDLQDAYQLSSPASVPTQNLGESPLVQKADAKKEPTKEEKPIDEIESRKKFNKLTKGTSQIYKVTMRSNVVYRLQTALGYETTIDLPEPALKVFIGDQELFKVGVYEKEVTIKPITDYKDARTNLQIFTQSGRLTFDVSVGPAETADFVLDFRLPEEDVLVENAFQRAVEEKKSVFQKEYQEKEKHLDEKAQNLAQEKFKKAVVKGAETIELRETNETDDIRVNLLSLSTIGDKAYLRFGIRNLSKTPYQISKVVVGFETYERKTFGLRKDPQGIIEFSSQFDIENPVPASGYVYGVVTFDAKGLGKKQYPVFLVFEEAGKRNLKIQNFKWIP